MSGQFVRLAEMDRQPVQISVDGRPVSALAGDTVLVAMLLTGRKLRTFEFGGEPRAGFCLMGACQDCWVWLAEGRQVRACTAYVEEGMELLTAPPEGLWPASAS